MRVHSITSQYYKRNQNSVKTLQENKSPNFESKFFTKKGYYLTALFAGTNVARNLFPNVDKEQQQTPVVKNYPNVIDNALDYSKNYDSENLYEAKKGFLDKVIKHPLAEQETIAQMIAAWIVRVETTENIEKTLPIMDLIMNNQELYDNKYIKLHLDEIAFDCTDGALEAKIYKQRLLEQYLRNPELQNNEVAKKIGSIVANTDTGVEFKLANMVFGNKIFYQNENILRYLKETCFEVAINETADESFEAKKAVLNMYLTSQDLQKNQKINEKIGMIVSATTSENLYLTETILKNNSLLANDSVHDYFGCILDNTVDRKKLLAKLNFINMINDFDLGEKLPIGQFLNAVDTEKQLSFLRNVVKDEKLLNNALLKDGLVNIVYRLEDETDVDIVNALITKPEVTENERVINRLPDYIADMDNDDNVHNLVKKFLDENDTKALLAFFKILDRISY